jgi:hypothetical protein
MGTWNLEIILRDACAGTIDKSCSITIKDPQCPLSFLSEDFIDPSGWQFGDLWHASTVVACVDCALLNGVWAYFGLDAGGDSQDPPCHYASQRPSHGSLVSPKIALPQCLKKLGVEFDSFRHVESYDGAYDQTWVEVSFDGGWTWQPIWYRDSSDASPECEHVRACCAVPGGANQAMVRFRFDSVDRYYNLYPGWAVDNVAIVNADLMPGFGPCGPLKVNAAALGRALGDGLSVMNIPNPVRGVDTTTFLVRGLGVEAIRVQIFNLDEVLVYEEEAAGNELVWHTANLAGEYLANGVYFYRAWAKIGDVWIPTAFQKLVILR